MLNDDEEPAKNKKPQLKNLDIMSVDELKEYITALQDEIKRVENAITLKQNKKAVAEAFFKS